MKKKKSLPKIFLNFLVLTILLSIFATSAEAQGFYEGFRDYFNTVIKDCENLGFNATTEVYGRPAPATYCLGFVRLLFFIIMGVLFYSILLKVDRFNDASNIIISISLAALISMITPLAFLSTIVLTFGTILWTIIISILTLLGYLFAYRWINGGDQHAHFMRCCILSLFSIVFLLFFFMIQNFSQEVRDTPIMNVTSILSGVCFLIYVTLAVNEYQKHKNLKKAEDEKTREYKKEQEGTKKVKRFLIDKIIENINNTINQIKVKVKEALLKKEEISKEEIISIISLWVSIKTSLEASLIHIRGYLTSIEDSSELMTKGIESNIRNIESNIRNIESNIKKLGSGSNQEANQIDLDLLESAVTKITESLTNIKDIISLRLNGDKKKPPGSKTGTN